MTSLATIAILVAGVMMRIGDTRIMLGAPIRFGHRIARGTGPCCTDRDETLSVRLPTGLLRP
jgi:hypothetical protein